MNDIQPGKGFRRIDSDIRLRYVSHMTRYAAALTEEYEVNF